MSPDGLSEEKENLRLQETYLNTDTRVTHVIKDRRILETVLIGYTVEHQTPLIGGNQRIFEKVVQYDLSFVGDKVGLNKRVAHIIEFETFALVKGPVSTGQVNSRGKDSITNIKLLFPSLGNLFSSMALVVSLRTRIPERVWLVQNETLSRDVAHCFAPRSMPSPSLSVKNNSSTSTCSQRLSPDSVITKINAHLLDQRRLAGTREWLHVQVSEHRSSVANSAV